MNRDDEDEQKATERQERAVEAGRVFGRLFPKRREVGEDDYEIYQNAELDAQRRRQNE